MSKRGRLLSPRLKSENRCAAGIAGRCESGWGLKSPQPYSCKGFGTHLVTPNSELFAPRSNLRNRAAHRPKTPEWVTCPTSSTNAHTGASVPQYAPSSVLLRVLDLLRRNLHSTIFGLRFLWLCAPDSGWRRGRFFAVGHADVAPDFSRDYLCI